VVSDYPAVVSDQSRGQRLLPLRMLANILTVLLAVVVVLIAARLAIQMSHLGSAHWRHSFIEFRLDKIADITMFGLSILFVVWFRRARINAERSAYWQRRAVVWAFWGWIVPIVSLWIPFQIMGDIWRAGRPAPQWRKTAWLPALWWTCWIVSGVGFSSQTGSNMYGVPHIAVGSETLSLVFLAFAGALLIAIVREVSYGAVGSPVTAPD
jgi:Domain of unknown function (DUF4328)